MQARSLGEGSQGLPEDCLSAALGVLAQALLQQPAPALVRLRLPAMKMIMTGHRNQNVVNQAASAA